MEITLIQQGCASNCRYDWKNPRKYDRWEKVWKKWGFVVQREVERERSTDLYVKKEKDILFFISVMDTAWNNDWNEAGEI